MEIDLSDKVAIITGGGSGIGRACCLSFADARAKVAVVALHQDSAQAVTDEINTAGGEAIAVQADVSQGEDVRRMIRTTVDAFGGLDIQFNNAGISPDGSVTDTSEELWDMAIAINLRGVFLGAKYAIPELRKRGGGVILNTAGTLGFLPCEDKAVYSAAKAGVVSLTRSIALDYARDNIRCNAVSPGLVPDTQLAEKTRKLTGTLATDSDPVKPPDESEEQFFEFQPLRGRISPEEVAALSLFLASDHARMITGQAYLLDGGQMAGLH